MVVTQSRKHCVWFVNEINKQLQERGMNFRSLVGFSGEVYIEGVKYTEYGMNQSFGHEGDVPLEERHPHVQNFDSYHTQYI